MRESQQESGIEQNRVALSEVSINRRGDDRRANARDEPETETGTVEVVRILLGGARPFASFGRGGDRRERAANGGR